METAVIERVDSHNLQDFLRIKDEDHRNNHLNRSAASNSGGGSGGSQSNHSGVTLQTILSDKRSRPAGSTVEQLPRVQSNRTLLDIIRDDQTSGYGGGHRDGRSSWRQLKKKLLLRRLRGASGWISNVHTPTSDVPITNNSNRLMMMTRHTSGRFNPNPNLAESTRIDVSAPINDVRAEEDDTAAETAGEGQIEAEQPVRMSLMSLLAETDRQLGLEGSAAYIMDEDGEAEEEECGGDGGVNGGGYNNCCVCMVRHKGAAFIPCGHTFCRLCSRELWAQRGNCPLCNNYIKEILDIF